MSGKYGGGGNACTICQKIAYPAETIQYEKKAYHVDCFQCSECKKKMEGPAGAANFEGTLFCKSCFQKGGYNQKQRNVVWTAKEGGEGGAQPSKFGGGGQKCTVCEKTVYAAETVAYEKKPYHSDCFKCSNCTKRMTPSGAAIFEEKLFCTKCFEQGGYRTKQAATASRVQGQAGAASSGPSKFGGGGNKCVKCDKTVYAAETVSFEKQAYHADCFKCDTCSKVMTASGAAVYESQLLCTKCFKDGGYERKQANSAREYKPSSSAAPSKFGGGGNKCYACGTTVYAAETLSYEKKPFHSDCFKCKNCSKKITPSGAEAKHTGDEIEVYCKKCWGDLGLNRAHINKKEDAAPAAAASEPAAAAEAPAAAEAGYGDAPAEASGGGEEPAAE
jgi:cysteine/glycine-rich protein